MNDLPLLGISIPTYKRPDELRKCVHSIIHSAGDDPVLITLVDDAADDTNDALFAELREQYDYLHIVKNEKNLGIDGNIQKAVDVCPSRYVWLLGEDDRMKPEGIPTVRKALQEHPVPFLYVNYSSTDDDVSFLIKPRSLPLREDQTMDGEPFYRTLSWSMGFIGACVIERAAWDPVDPSPYLNTYFAHVGRIMESIHGREVRLLAEPLILNRSGTPEAFTWTGDAVGVFTGWKRMTVELERIYSEEAGLDSCAAFTRAHGLCRLKFFAYLRADGVLHSDNVEDYLKSCPEASALFRFAARCIAALPCSPWRFARKILMNERKRRYPLPEAPR